MTGPTYQEGSWWDERARHSYLVAFTYRLEGKSERLGSFFLFIMYLCMAVLGFHCCVRFSPAAASEATLS